MPSTLFPDMSMLVSHLLTSQPRELAVLSHVNRRKACLTTRGLSWHCSTPACAQPGIGSIYPRTATSVDVMTHWIVICRRRGRATQVHNVASSQ